MLMKNFLKHMAGVCIFVVAFATAVALARFYGLLSAPVPWLGQAEMPEIRAALPDGLDGPNAPDAVEVPVAARFVTLDFERRRSYTTLKLMRDRHQAAPERLRVWTYFFTPEGAARREVWTAGPVELTRPFDAGETVTLNAEAACDFVDDPHAPRQGYYARVYITTDARAPVNLRAGDFDYDIKTASPVVVQAATTPSRR